MFRNPFRHLSDWRVDQLASAGLTPSDAELKHVLSCARCANQLAAAGDVEQLLKGRWLMSSAAIPVASTRPNHRFGLTAVSTALVLLVGAAVGVALLRTNPILTGPSTSSSPSVIAVGSASTKPPATDLPNASLPPTQSVTPQATSPAEGAASARPTGAVNVAGVTTVRSWSPDGQYLLVDSAGHHSVLGRDGSVVGSLGPSSDSADWLDSTTIVTLHRDGLAPAGHLSFLGIDGTETGSVDGLYERVVVSRGNRLIAAVAPATGDEIVGTSYRVWEDGVLSDARQGEPLAWSADGAKLALLEPTGHAPGAAGDEGLVKVVTRQGASLISVDGWLATTNSGVNLFSPGGRYLAVCLSDANVSQDTPAVRVIDTETGTVSESLPNGCAYNGSAWANDGTLYASDGVNPPHQWTPEDGVELVGISEAKLVTPGTDGDIAVWSDGSPDATLEIRLGDAVQTYDLPGLAEVAWSPDGTLVAAVSRSGSLGGQLELIPVR